MTDQLEPVDSIIEPTIVVEFTAAEAQQLYGSAASYETNVQRMVGTAGEVAHQALTKLAAAMHDVEVEPSPEGQAPDDIVRRARAELAASAGAPASASYAMAHYIVTGEWPE